MAEYSREYSKDSAFTGAYPGDNEPSGNKQIKVGSTIHMYDESLEDDSSALPKEDIIALIATQMAAGLSESFAYVTDVSIINGAIVKRTRTITITNGQITEISAESDWI